jgi:hypothetical protein
MAKFVKRKPMGPRVTWRDAKWRKVNARIAYQLKFSSLVFAEMRYVRENHICWLTYSSGWRDERPSHVGCSESWENARAAAEAVLAQAQPSPSGRE